MNILVACPTETEYQSFIRTLQFSTSSNFCFPLLTGVGKVNAASSVALELSGLHSLQTHPYDLVAVVGFAAGSKVFSQGDLVLPSACRYHDVQVPEGLVPELTSTYSLQGPDEVLCLTGDSFVDSTLADILYCRYGKDIIFDMESAAIAQVCEDLNIPVLVIKLISDIPQEAGFQSYQEFVQSHTDFSPILQYLNHL